MSLYEYRATVVRVLDGDTLDLDVDLGLRVHVQARVRLQGINAPELRAVGEDGERSRAHLLELTPLGSPVIIRTIKDRTEKYGRWLAVVWALESGGSVNQRMVDEGYAVDYDGGPRS